jgi:HSP20 family protein
MNNGEIKVMQDGSKALAVPAADALEMYSLPAADIYETPDAFVLLLDMPGAGKESISLRLDRNELTVKAPVGQIHAEQGTVLFRELRNKGYYRSFSIGDGIDLSNVDAQFHRGVLTVKLYKSESQRPREIAVN